MRVKGMPRQIIRFIQRLGVSMGLDIRRAHPNLIFWGRLPGGKPQMVLDIGANTGQFAFKALAAVPGCTVHSFEPLSEPFAALSKLAESHPNLQCHNFALGERGGTAIIHTGEYTPSSSLLKPAQHLTNSVPHAVPNLDTDIPLMRLDDWADTVGLCKPLFIKMDVQGYELQVMRGGRETFSQASAILTELSFVELYEGQPLISDVINAMDELGFQLVDIYEVARDPASGLGFQCDGLFLPKPLV